MAKSSKAGKRAHGGSSTGNGSATDLGFEQTLGQIAGKLRSDSLHAAEYKDLVLGLVLLKYVSDAFEEKHQQLEAERSIGADPEDPDEYWAEGLFWVPQD